MNVAKFFHFVRKKHFLEIFSLILLVLIFCRNFLTGFAFPAGMDSLGFASHISFYAKDWYSLNIWRDTAIGTGAPFYFLIEVNFLALVNKFINNTALVMNAFTILLIIGSAISIYIYSYSILENRIAGFISAVLYISNPFFSGMVAAYHLDVMIVYFLMPNILYITTKFTEIPSIRNTILLAVIFSFFGFARLHLLFIILPFLLIIFIYYSHKHKFEVENIKKLSTGVAISLLIFLVLISPTLLSLPSIFSGAHAEFRGRDPFIYSSELFYVFQGYNTPDGSGYMFWNWGYDFNTHPTFVTYILFLIPILAFSSLLFSRSKFHNEAVLFSIIAISSLFLAKGPYPPFQQVFLSLLDNITILKSFLTVPNRYLAISWLSYSLLVGITITEVSRLLTKKNKNIYCYGLMILFLIISFLMNPFLFTEGYQTLDLSKNEIEPHIWLAENSNISRYAAIPYGQGRMFTQDQGLNSDFGINAYMYSKIPSFSFLSGSSDDSSYFYQYTQHLVKKESDIIPKILGVYNVEYFVFQSYPFTQPQHSIYINNYRFNYIQHDFLKSQKALTKIYEGSKDTGYQLKVATGWANDLGKQKEPPIFTIINITRPPEIYRNDYTLPPIFSPGNKVLVVGGLESYLKLAELESFNFSKWNILFADHLIKKIGKDALITQINNSDYIAFVNSESLDLAMLLSNGTWINVNNFKTDSVGWRVDQGLINEGFFVLNKDVSYTREKDAKGVYSIEINNNSNYEIWIRGFLHNKAGKLKIFADGDLIGEVEAYTPQRVGFKWIKVGNVKLEKRSHKIEVVNKNGENKLNGIIIIEKDKVKESLNYVKKLVDKKSIYLLDTETHNRTENTDKNVIFYQNDKPIGIVDIRTEEGNSVKYLDFKKLMPSKWIVKVNSSAPYTLVFSNTYHPMWRAYVNGKEYNSIPSYYFINSFQINETGEHEVVIEFIGQRIQIIGLVISGFAYLGCFGYLFYDWRREKCDNWTLKVKNKLIRIIKRTGNKNDRF